MGHAKEPFPGDPQNQCHSAKRRSNPLQRCGKYCVVGYRRCLSHAPHLYKKGRLQHRQRKDLKGYYSRTAGVELKKRLEELASDDPSRRHSLQEEIDLARIASTRAVALFEAACLGTTKASEEAQHLALAGVRRAIDHVTSVVSAAAKVRSISLETVDVEQLDYIIDQVVMILEEEVLPVAGREALDAVTMRLRTIKLPERRTRNGAADPTAVAKMLRDAAGGIEASVTGETE